MTDAERKRLEAQRQQLENERLVAMAKANQATGAIAAIDGMLNFREEPVAPAANGHSEPLNPPS